MVQEAGSTALQEQLSRLRREGAGQLRQEGALVTAPGAMPPAWAVKVIGRQSYNLYNVEQVEIVAAGFNPTPVTGSETAAYNLAESFVAQGSVAEGTYAVMWRAGSKNVFYVKP